MLSGPHQKFAEGIASGLNQTEAYAAAYPRASAATARANGSDLLTNTDIVAEIARLRGEGQKAVGSTVLTLAEKLDILAGIARSKPADASHDNGLCELRMSKAGPFYAFPDKLRALELHAKLSGELSDKIKLDEGAIIHVTIGT